jgi:hypothetical protein
MTSKPLLSHKLLILTLVILTLVVSGLRARLMVDRMFDNAQ